MNKSTKQKLDNLCTALREMGSVAVAYSGGVDSTFLAVVAHDVLRNDMVAITFAGRVVPHNDIPRARYFCERRGMRHVEMPFDELSIPGFAANPPERCYLCKKELFTRMHHVAQEQGVRVVVDGSNKDDEGDFRPGMKALEELGVRSPLREVGLTKDEIREASCELGLPTWNMPSAACLASRIAYGDTIDATKLKRIDQAEARLRTMGLSELRVRMHGANGEIARIEVSGNNIERIAEEAMRNRVVDALRKTGFKYITLDLQGFRSGSMNEVLDKEKTNG